MKDVSSVIGVTGGRMKTHLMFPSREDFLGDCRCNSFMDSGVVATIASHEGLDGLSCLVHFVASRSEYDESCWDMCRECVLVSNARPRW